MKKIAIGIMSGTSLDGIDIVITEIDGSFLNTKINVIAEKTYPYKIPLLKKIKDCLNNEKSSSERICSLHFELAVAFSDAVKKLCAESNIDLEDVSFISSHGQTIYHINETTKNTVKSSLQLGDGSVIANLCNTTVVSNFRNSDIAAGGTGAPLVPFADYILFRDQEKSRALHNIGGISNMTIIPKNADIDDVFAFDTGPGNMMIDYAMNKLYKLNYDNNGEIAKSGTVIMDMLSELLDNLYFKQVPPKSTGRELFGDEYTELIITKYQKHQNKDIISTLTKFTALTIANAYKDFVVDKTKIDEIIVSGGGALNGYLLELIQEEMNETVVKKLETYNYSSEYKEALAFVILGNETLHHSFSNVPKATGARRKVILGQVSYVL